MVQQWRPRGAAAEGSRAAAADSVESEGALTEPEAESSEAARASDLQRGEELQAVGADDEDWWGSGGWYGDQWNNDYGYDRRWWWPGTWSWAPSS